MTLRRRSRMGAALAALIVVGGCANASSTIGSTATEPTPTAAGSTSTSSGNVVRLSETAAGQTVQVGLGDQVILTLHNTYWRIGPPDGRILTQTGSQQDSPATPGTCLPGVGCGTVQARFVAATAGSTKLTASRTTCGEAMACGPGDGSYSVELVVS